MKLKKRSILDHKKSKQSNELEIFFHTKDHIYVHESRTRTAALNAPITADKLFCFAVACWCCYSSVRVLLFPCIRITSTHQRNHSSPPVLFRILFFSRQKQQRFARLTAHRR